MECMTIPQCIITTHILCRIPAKSVGRFRCVSKEWLSLLTKPQFIQTHENVLNKNRHFIFESKDDGSLYSVPFNNHAAVSTRTKFNLKFYQSYSIHGSINGLVLASAYNNLHKDYTLLVLNPTTKAFVELPIPYNEYVYGLKGIGYDSVSYDYKVVHINRFESYMNVYSLRTKTLKQVSYGTYYYYTCHQSSSPGVFVNGFLHWIVGNSSVPVIVAFSLADEKLSELPPPCDIVSDHNAKLVALGDKLAIFNDVKGDVCLMNEYGVQKSWTKIVVHGFNEIPMDKPEVFYDNGKIVFLTNELLRTYDVEKGTFCESADISYMNLRKVMGAYVESLVSPKFSKSSKSSKKSSNSRRR